jgi:hypothetical protein
MTHLTLIVPFSVPPGAGDDATDDVVPGAVLRQLELPALGKLLTRATPGPRENHDDPYLRTLPQERWLAGRAGLDTVRVPTAPFMRLADHAAAGSAANQAAAGAIEPAGAWACLQPVHIHAARDHLVLMHPDQLAIRADEAAALRAAIDDLLAEAGIPLDAPHPARWYVPEGVFGDLVATTPVRATGRNIDIWMQAGARAREWRRLQNEIQMTWHDHPVNAARETEGKLPINSVWLHGGGAAAPVARLADIVLAEDPFLAGLALAGGSRLAAQLARFADIERSAYRHRLGPMDRTDAQPGRRLVPAGAGRACRRRAPGRHAGARRRKPLCRIHRHARGSAQVLARPWHARGLARAAVQSGDGRLIQNYRTRP